MIEESKNYICGNPCGLTVRNAALLVKMVLHSDSNVLIGVNGRSCSAKNILAILSLRIAYGDFVSVVADGPDAHEVFENMGDLFCENGQAGMCLPAYG